MLVVGAVALVAVVAGVLALGGDGDDQVQDGAASPAGTEASTPAPEITSAPVACAVEPTTAEEPPTLFETLSDGAKTDDPNFEMTFSAQVSDDAANSPADLTLDMIVRPGNVAPAAFYILAPPEWEIAQGCQFPIGLAVGTLHWDVRVGQDGNPCDQPGPLQFTMVNATTDIEDTISFLDADDNGELDFAEDKDRSGRADVIEKYPDFLNRMFPGRTPIRRAAGVFTYTDPPVLAQSLAFSSLDGTEGTTLVLLLQNIGDPDAVTGESGFTDYCTPSGFRWTEMGTTNDGTASITNPPAGEYGFILTAFGERDAESDGIENALDTCPFDANVGNPRLRGEGDADEDGLDAACDPNDFESKPDEDGDDYLNRGDICPLTKGDDPSTQKDSDDDEIGDECDTSGNGPTVADGEVPFVVRPVEVTIR